MQHYDTDGSPITLAGTLALLVEPRPHYLTGTAEQILANAKEDCEAFGQPIDQSPASVREALAERIALFEAEATQPINHTRDSLAFLAALRAAKVEG